jgi:phosphotransferase system IIB component
MKGTKDNITSLTDCSTSLLRADITAEQKKKARQIAKSKGMTFQGWLGQVIQKEIISHSQEASK